MLEYYSHLCACGCGGQIGVKEQHKYKGIPKYIHGHSRNHFKHGEIKDRLYHKWEGMKQRTLNPNNKRYSYYGGRGVTICPEWANDYTKFRDWALNNGYADNLVIDRRDNNGNYSPENCRWLIKKENIRQRRTTKINIKIANEIRALYATGKYTQRQL